MSTRRWRSSPALVSREQFGSARGLFGSARGLFGVGEGAIWVGEGAVWVGTAASGGYSHEVIRRGHRRSASQGLVFV